MAINEALYSSASVEWATPQPLFDQLDAEFGFTLDVCATAENAKCERFYDMESDGLAQEWSGVVWMNPPYGRDIAAWMAKAHEASRNGATVVCLVHARTDTRWWHDHAMHADEMRFIKGRVKFGGAPHSSPFPSVVLVFRPGLRRRRVNAIQLQKAG